MFISLGATLKRPKTPTCWCRWGLCLSSPQFLVEMDLGFTGWIGTEWQKDTELQYRYGGFHKWWCPKMDCL